MSSELVLEVEKLIWRGRGLSRLDSGKVVLVEPGVFPGERVKVRINREKKDYLEAVWTEILDPLPERRLHPCRYSGACGGCRFGVIPGRIQLAFKQSLLLDELNRGVSRFLDKDQVQLDIFQSPKGWRYRWRGQIHVHTHRPHFTKLNSHELVPLDDCLLMARVLGQGLERISQGLPNGRHTVAADPLQGGVRSGADENPLFLPLQDYQLRLQVFPGSFFQANWLLNQQLVAYVTSNLSGYGRVADLYAGAGNFALPLSTVNERVLALESDPRAVASCSQSGLENGLDNLAVKQLDLGPVLPGEVLAEFAPRGLVLDPPRTGGGKQGLASLGCLNTLKRLVWVSCDLVNTCRDIRPLLKQGWSIQKMALFDMFPQTWHLETVFVLDKDENRQSG